MANKKKNTKKQTKSIGENKELKEFFDEVKEKEIKVDEELKEREIETLEKKEVKKDKNKDWVIKNLVLLIAVIFAITYFIIYIKNAFNDANYFLRILNASSILGIVILSYLAVSKNKSLRNIFGTLSALLVIGIVTVNVLNNKDILKLPTYQVLKDYKNTNISEVMKWASKNKIDINSTYEYSDNILEGNIITQDVLPGTLLKKVKEINFVVSDGPNYDKEVILSSLIGLKLDDVLNTINEKHLSNVEIIYEVSDSEEKDVVISQSIKGTILRKDKVTFYISLGNKDALKDIKIDNLVNKKEFDATLYLKRNGIKYELKYDFSDTVKKGYVISQDKKVGSTVSPKSDTVTLTISEGKKIVVPDFSNKDVNDVIDWASKNNLKLSFTESYDLKVKNGKLININYNKGDVIKEGTKIIINTSKGPLILPKYNSTAELLSWANTNNVKHTERYEFNNSVKRGEIIKVSKEVGCKIDPANDEIVITLSQGAPITVPNFRGQSKNTITNNCRKLGLSCGFYYTGYSATAKDVATTQNVTQGSKVIAGTYVSIGLSSGPAQTFTVYIEDTWLKFGSYSESRASLLRNLQSRCPGVTFNIISKSDNSKSSGMFHEDSPIKGQQNYFTQGKTYTIILVS